MDQSTEAALVARAREQDPEAFAALVSRYRAALEGIVVPLVRDRSAAQDVVQETILKAQRNLHRYRDEHRFSTWFFRIGVNLAISGRRREAVEQRALEATGPLALHRATSPGSGPVDVLVRREDGERLRRAIRSLPERYREVLALRYVREMSCKDIAVALATTPNTVSIILFRAKERLRQELEP